MRNSKLIRLLRAIKKEEFKTFGKLVKSPFFYRNKKCIELYELLIPYAPDFTNPVLDDKTFSHGIYKNPESFRTLKNEFIGLIEEYMIQREFKKKEGDRKHILLKELRIIGEKKHFNLVYNHSLKKIKKKKKNTLTYRAEYLLELSQLRMLYEGGEGNQLSKASQLNSTIRAFDKYTLSSHLWLDNTVFNLRRRELTDDIEDLTSGILSNSEFFAELANRQPYGEEPLIKLHLLLRQLHLKTGETEFNELFDALQENYASFGHSDYHYFYISLVNFCSQKIFQGNDDYYKQLLRVYLLAIKADAFLNKEGYLDFNRMRNIIVAAVRSNRITLAHNLLNKYIKFVNPIFKDAARKYCEGYLYFHQKKYDSAIDSFGACYNLKSVFELESQVEIFKTYYETNQTWGFGTPLKSFITKLSRQKKKHTRNSTKSYINFLRILKQIYTIKGTLLEDETLEEFKQKINNTKYISANKWLLQKLSESALEYQVEIYKNYYETNERWAFNTPLENFIKKLSIPKEKNTDNSTDSFINFLITLQFIYKNKEASCDKKILDEIKTKINYARQLMDKEWLLEKLDELFRINDT